MAATNPFGFIKHTTTFSFVKNIKATQTVSFKALQSFISSLNKNELQHMIVLYLKSVMKEFINHDSKGLILKESVERLINTEPQKSDSHTINNQILNKIQDCYGNHKYNKKSIVKQLQQNHPQNKHLLSITPHILSSILQFLTFRELCKMQSTCSYFVYLHHNMNGNNNNCFINLDHKFWQRAMQCRITYFLKGSNSAPYSEHK